MQSRWWASGNIYPTQKRTTAPAMLRRLPEAVIRFLSFTGFASELPPLPSSGVDLEVTVGFLAWGPVLKREAEVAVFVGDNSCVLIERGRISVRRPLDRLTCLAARFGRLNWLEEVGNMLGLCTASWDEELPAERRDVEPEGDLSVREEMGRALPGRPGGCEGGIGASRLLPLAQDTVRGTT